jgi:intraflagellar transport protein 74
MTAFMDKFDETRGGIIQEQQAAQELIIALLEHLSKGIEDSSQLPTQEAMGEMEEAKHFKEKNLATAKRTMESLFAEKKKRERELEILRTSEPRLTAELNDLRQLMTRMHSEMKEFQDIDKLRREYDATQRKLQDMKQSYIRRRDSMRQQVQALNMESEALKRSLAANEVAKEIEETERRLKLNERTIFDLREFVDTRTRETDFEVVKGTCLKLMDTLNNSAINKCQGSMPNTRQGPGAQAKW